MKQIILLTVSLLTQFASQSQTIIQRDPEIEKMVNEVSKDSLQSYIKKLVSFGTRNTLSTRTEINRGIGAARNWVLSRFNEFAKQSNGRLTAFIDTTTLQPDGRRVDGALGGCQTIGDRRRQCRRMTLMASLVAHGQSALADQ